MRRLLFVMLLLGAGWTRAAERYVLSVDPAGSDEVRVVVGTKLLKFKGIDPQVEDVGKFLHQGSNPVRLGWSGVSGPALISLAHLDGQGRAEILFRYRIDPVFKPPSGVIGVAVVRSPAVPNLARLHAFVSKGLVRLFLNGQPLGDYASIEARDISAFLLPGRNTLKIVWSKDFGNSLPTATLRIQSGDRTLVEWEGPKSWVLAGSETVEFER